MKLYVYTGCIGYSYVHVAINCFRVCKMRQGKKPERKCKEKMLSVDCACAIGQGPPLFAYCDIVFWAVGSRHCSDCLI